MSKKIMTKNTDKQAIDNLADNFNGYAALGNHSSFVLR